MPSKAHLKLDRSNAVAHVQSLRHTEYMLNLVSSKYFTQCVESIWDYIDKTMNAYDNIGTLLESLDHADRGYHTLVADIQSGKTQWGYIICWYAVFKSKIQYIPYWLTFNLKGSMDDLMDKVMAPTSLIMTCITQGIERVMGGRDRIIIDDHGECMRHDLIRYFQLNIGEHTKTLLRNTIQISLGNQTRIAKIMDDIKSGKVYLNVNKAPLLIGDEWHTWCGVNTKISHLRQDLLTQSVFRMVGITATPNAVLAADRGIVKIVRPQVHHVANSKDVLGEEGIYRPYEFIIKRHLDMPRDTLAEKALFLKECIARERERVRRLGCTKFVPLLLAVGVHVNNHQEDIAAQVRKEYAHDASVFVSTFNQDSKIDIGTFLNRKVPDTVFTDPNGIVVIVAHRSMECSISVRPDITRHGRTLHGLTGQVMLRIGDKCDIEEQRLRILGRYAENFPNSILYFACENDQFKLDTIVNIQRAVRADEPVRILSNFKLTVYRNPIPRVSQCQVLSISEYEQFKMLHGDQVYELAIHTNSMDTYKYPIFTGTEHVKSHLPLSAYTDEVMFNDLHSSIVEAWLPSNRSERDLLCIPTCISQLDEVRMRVVFDTKSVYDTYSYVVGMKDADTPIDDIHCIHIDTPRHDIQRMIRNDRRWVCWKEIERYVVVHCDSEVYEAMIVSSHK